MNGLACGLGRNSVEIGRLWVALLYYVPTRIQSRRGLETGWFDMKGKVTEKKILSVKGKNLYLVNWSRIANFGYDIVRADTEQEAFENHLYSKNKEVNFIITKIDENNMPVIFEQKKCYGG